MRKKMCKQKIKNMIINLHPKQSEDEDKEEEKEKKGNN